MASVVKHFVARHGVAVGTTPTTVISDSGVATFTNLSVSGSLQAALNLNSQSLTNANIDSGTIDNATIATSNITVGSTKTLDVSAGTLTLANDQISGDKIHAGTISGPVTISTPYIATIYAQAGTGGVLDLRSNSTDTTTGYVSVPMTTASTTVGTGALVVAGGLGVTGQSTLGNVVVTGNLTVNGTTTTFNSTTVTIDDPIFTLGGDTAPGSDDNKDRGIEFRWHNGTAARVGFFGFDDSTGKFTFIPDATNTSEVFSGTKGTLDAFLSASDLTAGTISSTILANSTVYVGTTAIALNRGSAAQSLTGITSIDGSAATLTTARAINGVDFNGSAAITVPINVTDDTTTNATYYPALAQATTGNTSPKVSSTKLTFNPSTGALTATSFVGPLTGNATTATTLQTTRAINGVDFNGSAAITVPVNVTQDNATNATYYPVFAVAATTGNQSARVSSTKLTFNPSTGVLAATTFSGSAASLTSVPAGQLTGTIPSAVLGNSTVYVGTTAIALNRGSAAQALTGITSIDGSAASVANAVTFNNGGTGDASGTTFNGSAARTISYNTIGAAASSHTHSYLPLSGGTLTGTLNIGNQVIEVGSGAGTLTSGSSFAAGNGDGASSTVANIRIASWYGIGFTPTVSGQTIPQGENAVFIDVREGTVTARGIFISTSTAANILPVGTEAQRPGSPSVGMIRYSSTAGEFEGYTAAGWGSIGGGGALKFTQTIGNGSAQSFTITHNLNTAALTVSVRDIGTGYFTYPDVKYSTDNAVIIEFATVPTSNQYFVTVIG